MNVLIVEDEAPAARRLERMLREQLGERVAEIAIAHTLETARAALAASQVDLLLLDLNLNGADGFSLLDTDKRPRTIVVSANAGRAIDAFDHAVIDFVAKPVSAERLGLALERAMERAPAGAGHGSLGGKASIAVRSAGRIDLAAFVDIVLLSGADDYVEVVLADGRRFLHDARLQDLERLLPPGFVRIHRSHIANTAHLHAVRTLPGRRRILDLAGGATAPVSRTRLGALERWLPR